MTAIADAIGISRQHLSAMHNRPPSRRRGRPPLPDAELVADIRALVADLPTYGYRRVHALLHRQAQQTGRAAPNPQRIYPRHEGSRPAPPTHSGKDEEQRHDDRRGRPAQHPLVLRRARDRLRTARRCASPFVLDCCDREAMGHVATTSGITAGDGNNDTHRGHSHS